MSETTTENDEIQNVIEELKKHGKKRLGNPFFMSYFISWLICNWKFLFYIIFSGDSVEEKLNKYEYYLPWFMWLYPLIGVCLYLFGLNYLEYGGLGGSKHGYRLRLKSIEERETQKIESDLRIAHKRIELQDEQIRSGKLNQLIAERDYLITQKETLSNEKNLVVKENARLKKELTNEKSTSSRQISTFSNYFDSISIIKVKEAGEKIKDLNLTFDYLNQVEDSISTAITLSINGVAIGQNTSNINFNIYKGLSLFEEGFSSGTVTHLGIQVYFYLKNNMN